MDQEFLDKLELRLLTHRYRYYVLDNPMLDDVEYDLLERMFLENIKRPTILNEMVGFNKNEPLAQKAKTLVDTKTDDYSLWVEEMAPIWSKLGMPQSGYQVQLYNTDNIKFPDFKQKIKKEYELEELLK